MGENPIREARRLGQSIWCDSLSRQMLTSGELRRMVNEDGLGGVTSNPTIFEKAMSAAGDYDRSLRELLATGVTDARALYEHLAIEDIREAAALLRPLYDATARGDGYVSLEVSPEVAHDTAGSLAEARRLFQAVGRENVMIKIPGTPEGMPVIERLVAEGINVNVTLLFGLPAYRACAEAHRRGLERWIDDGGDPERVHGVASFFLSRIDTAIDERVQAELASNPPPERRRRLELVRGRVAVANAKMAYQLFEELQAGEAWRALAAHGARPQRLLWASTGTKNPAYPKTMYVDPLIGPDTVNTMPLDTFHYFREHGRPRPTVREGREGARATLQALDELGISLDQLSGVLVEKGIELFARSLDRLLATLEARRAELSAGAHPPSSP